MSDESERGTETVERPPPQDPPGPRGAAAIPELFGKAANVSTGLAKDWWNWRTSQLTPEAVEESVATAGGPIGVSAPGLVAGPLRWSRSPQPADPKRVGWNFNWAPTEEGLRGGQYDVYGSGQSDASNEANVIRDIIMGAGTDYSTSPPTMKPFGFEKAEAAWREIAAVLKQHGFNLLDFFPVEGQFGGRGPTVSKAARVKFNEMLTGSKATLQPDQLHYRLPLTTREEVGKPPLGGAKAEVPVPLAPKAPAEMTVAGPSAPRAAREEVRGAAGVRELEDRMDAADVQGYLSTLRETYPQTAAQLERVVQHSGPEAAAQIINDLFTSGLTLPRRTRRPL